MKEFNSEQYCDKCGIDVFTAADKGRYFGRISPVGSDQFIGACRPSCTYDSGDQNTALLGALEADKS